MSELSEILGEEPGTEGLATSETGQAEQQRETPASEQAGQHRDENGRFARQEQRGDAERPEARAETQQPQPSAREQELERQNQFFQEQMKALFAQRAPQREEPKKDEPPQLWQDPDKYFEHGIETRLSPIEQRMRDDRLFFSEQLAVARYGEEKVQEAARSLETYLRSNPHEIAVVQQNLLNSRDPMGDVLRWAQRQSMIQTVGDDPAKWRDSEIKRMIGDPAERAKLIEMLQAAEGGEQQQQQHASQARQQDQGKPAPKAVLPPSLGKLPSGRQAVDGGDMSDASLFSYATH